MDSHEQTPIVLMRDEGREIGPGALVVKASAEATRGAYVLLENVMPSGRTVPPHVHHTEEEAWYVVEGELTFRIGDREVSAPKGSFVLVPRGVAHGFGNVTDADARFLQIFSPPGFERYFEERAALAAEAATGAKDYAGLDDEAHAALAAQYHMEFV